MQVDAAAALTHLRIGRRPLARLLQIPFKGFSTLLVRNIKVDDDMVLRQFDIVKFCGVEGGQLGGDLFPLSPGRTLVIGILGQAVGAIPVEGRGLALHKVDDGMGGFLSHRFFLRSLLLELLRPKPAVIVPNAGAVSQAEPLLVAPEVVLQLLLKYHAGNRVGHLGVIAVGLIHLPGRLQRYPVLLLEHMIGIHHEVVEIIGGPHHGDRNIIVVVVRVLQIHLLAVIGNAAQFKGDLLGQRPVLRRGHLVSRGGHIDQPPDDARLGVRDLHRLVGAHDQKCLEPVGIGRTKLFVDRHHLMGDQAVDPGVVLNTGKVTIMLDRHQRIGPECFQSEGVAGGTQILGIETGVVALEKLLDHIDDRALSRSHRTVEHQEFLNPLGLPGNDGPDAPLDFVALLGRI